MEKKEYIQQQILDLVQYSCFLVFLAGIFIIMGLTLLDYFVTPENFNRFLIYRIITSSLFLLLIYLSQLSKKKSFQFIISFLATLIVASMVELMILSFGGHQSPYYVGMILILFFLGIVPLSFLSWLFCAFLVYLVYFFPIILFDEITNLRIFINNNIFLIACLIGCIIWRYFDSKLFLKKLSLEYDLSQEKEKLTFYSQNLEKIVEERTAELEEERASLAIKVKARTKELEELAESLDEKVKERTKELQKRIEELEKFHKLTVGRELKMMELKKETKRLQEELKRYKKI